MGRRCAAGTLALGAALVPILADAGSGPASEARAARAVSAEREALRSFDEYPLYDAGPRVDGLPLAAVVRRDDTADFVSFVYGDCVAGDDAGCAPPAEVQVWPACRRSLALYEPAAAGGVVPERAIVRGVEAGLFDEGTRLELETRRATIVVFGDTRARVLRIANALRALDGSVRAEAPLPPPVRAEIGGAIDC
ncbi:MAG: hypothetical protein ACRDZV_15400 [Acidimicrobiia bacterium]